MFNEVIRRSRRSPGPGRITIFTIFLILIAMIQPGSAVSSGVLGDEVGLVISIEPTVNQTIINNNYTSYGGYTPGAPWLWNSSGNLYFNETLMNETIDARDSDTTYSEDSPYLDLTGTVFSLIESVLNTTIQTIVEGYGYITSAFNQTYHDTSLDVTANRSSWLSTYNATYDAKPDTTYNASYHETWQNVSTNSDNWLNQCINSTYESTYNTTYDSTSKDVTENRTQWATDSDTTYSCSDWAGCTDLTTTYNATYDAKPDTTFNQTYHNTTLDVSTNRTAWETDTDTTYSESDHYLTQTGTVFGINETRLNATIDDRDDVGSGEGGKSAIGPYLYNDTDSMYFNETVLNATCDARDDDTTYSCGDWLGCTDLTTTYNATYDATSQDVTANRTTWESTYNASYHTAWLWGDHSLAGYLTSYTETDPLWTANSSLVVYTSDTSAWDKNEADDFSGSWNDLSNRPADLVDGDNDTEYSESDPYLTLVGTVFGLDESVLNATIDARDDDTTYSCSDWSGCTDLTTTFNETYHNTSLDVQDNRSTWESKFNQSYHDIMLDVQENRTQWATDEDTTYSENDYYLTLSGTEFGINETRLNATIDARDDIGSGEGGKTAAGPYLYNDTDTMYFNETLMNATCDARDDDTTYSCSDWSGCTDLTTTFNETYHNTSLDVQDNRSTWESKFNQSYHDIMLDVQENRTAWETDTNTEYSESDPYLTLVGTVFGLDESVLNATIDARDDDTTYSEDSPYLDLSGTVFTLIESVLNATIENIVESYGYITTAFNQTYHDTWLNVQANQSIWEMMFNQSYHDTMLDVQENRTQWANQTATSVETTVKVNSTGIYVPLDVKVYFGSELTYIMKNSTTGNLTICNECD